VRIIEFDMILDQHVLNKICYESYEVTVWQSHSVATQLLHHSSTVPTSERMSTFCSSHMLLPVLQDQIILQSEFPIQQAELDVDATEDP
jgi:hypothetical protein